jgi:hypothetical protein
MLVLRISRAGRDARRFPSVQALENEGFRKSRLESRAEESREGFFLRFSSEEEQ